MKEGFESIHNRFYVRGEGEYLYQYNYGNLAGDPRTAALNPLHALGTIEPTLEKFRKERTLLEKDVPSSGRSSRAHGAKKPTSRP